MNQTNKIENHILWSIMFFVSPNCSAGWESRSRFRGMIRSQDRLLVLVFVSTFKTPLLFLKWVYSETLSFSVDTWRVRTQKDPCLQNWGKSDRNIKTAQPYQKFNTVASILKPNKCAIQNDNSPNINLTNKRQVMLLVSWN